MTSSTSNASRSLADKLYAPISDEYRGPVLPIRQLTREEMERELDAQCNTQMKMRKLMDSTLDRTISIDSQGRPVHRISLRDCTTEPLFPASTSGDTASTTPPTTASFMTPKGLQLFRIPPVSLYAFDTSAVSVSPIKLPIFLDPKQYVAKRKRVNDDHGGRWTVHSTSLQRQQQEEPLGAMEQAAATSTTAELQHPTATSVGQQSRPMAAVDLSQYPYFRPGLVPVCATPFQQGKCDPVADPDQSHDDLDAKNEFVDIIGRLNHPAVAMVDGYDVFETRDIWADSGKTWFLRELIQALQEGSTRHLKFAIATYDMNDEGFLHDRITQDLNLPCTRISMELDINWEREYGVLFTLSDDDPHDLNAVTADLVLAFDIRLRPENSVFKKILSRTDASAQPPAVWLATAGSVEIRAANYMAKDARRWSKEWWSDEPDYRDLVRRPNSWLPQDQATALARKAVQSVTVWVQNGFPGRYHFVPSTSTSAATTATTDLSVPVVEDIDMVQPADHHSPIVEQSAPPSITPSPQQLQLSVNDMAPTAAPMEMTPSDSLDARTTRQVQQLFRHPFLFPSSSKGTPPASHSTIVHPPPEEDADDDASSFYSASEFADVDAAGIQSQLGPLWSEYLNKCQSLRAKHREEREQLRARQLEEKEQLYQLFEPKAVKELLKRQQ